MQPLAAQPAHLEVGVTDARSTGGCPPVRTRSNAGSHTRNRELRLSIEALTGASSPPRRRPRAVTVVDSQLDPATVNVREVDGGMDALVGDLQQRASAMSVSTQAPVPAPIW